MSAALRPVVHTNPLAEFRAVCKRKLDQVLEIAVEERLSHKPDRKLLGELAVEQRVWLTVLNDLDHALGGRQ